MLLISIAEDLKDLEATQARLLQNPKDIANVFARYYGSAAVSYTHLLKYQRFAEFFSVKQCNEIHQ